MTNKSSLSKVATLLTLMATTMLLMIVRMQTTLTTTMMHLKRREVDLNLETCPQKKSRETSWRINHMTSRSMLMTVKKSSQMRRTTRSIWMMLGGALRTSNRQLKPKHNNNRQCPNLRNNQEGKMTMMPTKIKMFPALTIQQNTQISKSRRMLKTCSNIFKDTNLKR